ncbi:MAG: divalent cation tolerance protein CutA [Bacteroidota bacterium]|nr:divalent cation tolerance protein CutA [Bacteroidota bacterium]
MINAYIYLDSQKDAMKLVKGLVENDLIAHASIDKDNHSLMKMNGNIMEQINFVITGQTKGLLFDKILEFIAHEAIENTRVYSVPITQCNENFGEIIRKNTKKI